MSLDAGARRSWRNVLPSGPGVRWFSAAGLVNALGTGFFLPFALVFYAEVSRLSLGVAGTALTVASLVVLPLVPAVGRLTDRVGARTVLITAALVRAAVFAGYLVLPGLPAFVVLTMVGALAFRADQAAGPTLAVALAPPGERSRWLALSRVVSNAGIGAGAALGGLLVAARSDGLHALGLINAASFLAAALCYTRLGRTGTASPADRPGDGGGDRPWRDLRFVRTALANALLWLTAGTLESALPIHLLRGLHLPAWSVGLFFTLNTALMAFLQLPVARRLESHRPARVLIAGCLLHLAVYAALPGLGGLGTGLAVTLLVPLVVVWTAGELLAMQEVTVLLAGLAPEHRRGSYLAVSQIPVGVAVALTPLLATVVGSRPTVLWLVLAALTVVVAALAHTERDTRSGPGGVLSPAAGPAKEEVNR
ncbi:MFS transporter [Kitasatospora herbaricolor]|uniref:MFS transporter n=1 Tax=Kitasatospora herbaricolor TaxID=68217 RepID=UPI00174B9A6D|nr:MFS transporter [Kitasatospora herbaricolor]MDQ0309529.1 putative MFS family arabinose efflux permease [Kitasatospora herbaricolor]GGV01246.1 MFS transporter [Kitasatospora herbaricolor]